MVRIVLHLDMDAFFAAIEERDYPQFHGFPIVVGADPKEGTGRGVVSTANYAARKYGVHSAQPISTAWRLCRQGEDSTGKKCIFFRGNFEKYERESEKIMAIAARYAEALEQVSVDEAYLMPKIPMTKTKFPINPSNIKLQRDLYTAAEKTAKKVKRDIYDQTKLTCSIGIGPNKLVAKIASDIQKPDGLTIIHPANVQSFLDPLPIRVIPGIGPKAENALKKLRVQTIAKLRALPLPALTDAFGVWGKALYQNAQGIDDRVVGDQRPVKSLGREHTFAHDVFDANRLVETLNALSLNVAQDVREAMVQFQKVELKVRFANFHTVTRQITLTKPSAAAEVINRTTLRLFLPFLDRRENPSNAPIRLIGVRVGKLTEKT